jgi:hypothetical protein
MPDAKRDARPALPGNCSRFGLLKIIAFMRGHALYASVHKAHLTAARE